MPRVRRSKYGNEAVDNAQLASSLAQNMTQLTEIKNANIRKRIANRISDAAIADLRLVAFEVERETEVNRVRGYVKTTDAGQLVEVGIFDSKFKLIATSEPREVPQPGEFEFALPQTTLTRGTYYYGFVTNGNLGEYGVNAYLGGLTVPRAFPLPQEITNPTPIATVPSAMILGADLPKELPLLEYTENNDVKVYGTSINPWGYIGETIYGWHSITGKIVRSNDAGATWEPLMSYPYQMMIDKGDTIIDLFEKNGILYMLGNKCTLYKTDGLLPTSSWIDVSCPIDDVNLRHTLAVGRPYGFQLFNGYIYVGEYTHAPNELTYPRILRYEIATGTWVKSYEVTNGRHIHSFYALGDIALYCSVGDAGFSGLGVFALDSGGIGLGTGGNVDAWYKWTSAVSPNSNHYPVDFMRIAGVDGVPDGLYMTSDRPGYHLLYTKVEGGPGSFNISPQLFDKEDSGTGETVFSLVKDKNNNLYWWTAETTNPALYVSPPPYTQSALLKKFDTQPFLTRSVSMGDYVMMFDQRFKIASI
jgi:hypothetical protein